MKQGRSVFLSGMDGSVGVACLATILVPHLSLNGRPAFDSGDHTFFFGVGLSALGSTSHLPLMLIVVYLRFFRRPFDFLTLWLVAWESDEILMWSIDTPSVSI